MKMLQLFHLLYHHLKRALPRLECRNIADMLASDDNGFPGFVFNFQSDIDLEAEVSDASNVRSFVHEFVEDVPFTN